MRGDVLSVPVAFTAPFTACAFLAAAFLAVDVAVAMLRILDLMAPYIAIRPMSRQTNHAFGHIAAIAPTACP